jgi:16S rRNA (uracil1498-N3)-methyltransferase
MHRFFVPTNHRTANDIILAGDIAHQIARVLRLRPNEEIVLVPTDAPDAVEWRVRLAAVEARGVTGTVIAERPGLPEPTCAVTLCTAVLKGERFDWLVQKATELGVAAIQPVITANTVRKVGPGETNALERWRRIATEAAEQSGRSRIPMVHAPVALDSLGADAPEPWFVAHESVRARTLAEAVSPNMTTVSVVIGPEGGLADAEVERLTARGAVPVSLGPRILRAETAAITAVTLALAATNNLEPPRERAWREIRDTEE